MVVITFNCYETKSISQMTMDLFLLTLIFVLFFFTDKSCSSINASGATSGAGTAYTSEAPEFTPVFLWGSCYWFFSFMCMICRLLFVLLSFFFWPLCCLFSFDIRILITLLVSSNSSYQIYMSNTAGAL